jgi:murein DD-endopeptidase MepM/ murein hydrolase activator NlpD
MSHDGSQPRGLARRKIPGPGGGGQRVPGGCPATMAEEGAGYMSGRRAQALAGRRGWRCPAGGAAARGVAGILALVTGLLLVAVVPGGQARAAAPGIAAGAGQAELTPVIESVISPPRWYRGDDGRFHMEYELLLINTIPLPVKVTGISVLDGHGQPIESLSGGRLTAAMTLLGEEDKPATLLPASAAGVAWLDLSFATRGQIPAEVEHRLTVNVGPGHAVGPIITFTGGQARTVHTAPETIGPPLQGGRWVAIVGPHRRALQAVNGALSLGQRFAIDFSARLDTHGRTYAGNPDANASYFDYGQPVLAVAAGTVVEAVDSLPDQIPNHPSSLPTAELDGNHVILSLGQGVYAGYAHLRPGSVRVRPGQHVRAGQILAELGNSGASGGPHLHFQLMNAPSLLAADGLPFGLGQFYLDGFTPSLTAFLHADQTGTPVPIDTRAAGLRQDEGLTGLEVLRFPGH